MSHVSFANSQRFDRLETQSDKIEELRSKLSSDLDHARKSGNYGEVKELKAEMKVLEELGKKVDGALKMGALADSPQVAFSDTAFFKVVRPLDDISDEIGEALESIESGESLEDTKSGKSDGSSSMPVSGVNADGDEYTLDGPYLLELQRNDPEAFRAALEKVPDGLKQEAYMNIQNEIQSENRFWSMMTSLQQANHDTAKKIIGNFRV